MASSSKLANILWGSFFIYYTVYKYLASLQIWDSEFAVQVAILSLMTAFVPYYATRLALHCAPRSYQLAVTLIFPLMFCAIGYIVFYYTRIVPFFDGVSLRIDVMPRSIFPAIVISLLFLIEQYFVYRDRVSEK